MIVERQRPAHSRLLRAALRAGLRRFHRTERSIRTASSPNKCASRSSAKVSTVAPLRGRGLAAWPECSATHSCATAALRCPPDATNPAAAAAAVNTSTAAGKSPADTAAPKAAAAATMPTPHYLRVRRSRPSLLGAGSQSFAAAQPPLHFCSAQIRRRAQRFRREVLLRLGRTDAAIASLPACACCFGRASPRRLANSPTPSAARGALSAQSPDTGRA